MATVTQPQQSWQPTETDRRVRHPLQALRGYIRSYVLIEGLMVAVIFVALWFWIGLLLDFGAFKAFPIRQDVEGRYEFGGFDWIQSLQWISPEGQDTAGIVRIVLLFALGVALLVLVAYKVFFRLFVEFRDSALALVLERRFPQQLGDRLITAVELADPALSDKYGLSRAMVDKTIKEAAQRVEELPVRQVFNWRRLRFLTLAALGLTVGLYLLLWGTFIGVAAAIGAPDAPTDFFWRFNHVAGIWGERNVLVKNTYWPRQAHLEIIRFQDTETHRDEMRVGRDEQRPDIQVRGAQWVLADTASPDGWRSLRWSDLPQLGDTELTTRARAVDFPADWPSWIIDLGDLDEQAPTGILDPSWQNKTSGEIREAMKQTDFQNSLVGLGKRRQAAEKAIADLLNWQTWTVDKIALQEEKGEVRRAMTSSRHKALENVIDRLVELADAVEMGRTLRKLDVPERVEVYYRGKKTKSSAPYVRISDNKFMVGLGDLQESVEFTVRGYDFYTRPRKITLVPPPTIVSLKVDKEEPAYVYYRVQGDQGVLKGKKQTYKNVPISISGDTSIIQVPLGTDMTLTAESDRKLKDSILIVKSDKAKAGAQIPLVEVTLQKDKRTFTTHFDNVFKPFDFQFVFIDEDNVKGKRRVIIEPVDDKIPDVALEMDPSVVLRKPSQQKGAAPRRVDEDGFLVTPDALIPFKGTIRDDYALTEAKWLYEIKKVDVELGGKGLRHIDDLSLVVSGLQFNPINPAQLGSPHYWTWVAANLLTQPATEESTPLEEFRKRLRDAKELPLNALEEKLKSNPERMMLLREHNIKDEFGFDFYKFLGRLKVHDLTRDVQQHYLVKVYVTATDNNVETGPGTSLRPKATTFLVVSENELLAQIFLEEETIRERLEKVHHQLENARTTLNEQITALSSPGSKLSQVAFRISESQKGAGNAASNTREIHRDYSRILTELKVNRIKQQKIDSVDNEIVRPLGVIVNPNPEPADVMRVGNFTTTEDALAKLYQAVDVDATAQDSVEEGKQPPSSLLQRLEQNRGAHLQGAQLSRDHMNRLIADIKIVLDNMEEGLDLGRVTAILVGIERQQQEELNRLTRFYDQRVADVFNDLLNPKQP